MQVETTFFTRDGHPMMMEVTKTDDGSKTVAVGNAMVEGDIEVSEAEYNTAMVALQAAKVQAVTDYIADRAIKEAEREAAMSSATTKLTALGLTAEEVQAMFG